VGQHVSTVIQAGVEKLLGNGLLLCPCGGRLGGWGHAARAARRQGFRSIAAATGVREDTVRDRLRRFRGSASRVREFFTGLAGMLAPDPVPLAPAGAAWPTRWLWRSHDGSA
jgi:hypothetical protein